MNEIERLSQTIPPNKKALKQWVKFFLGINLSECIRCTGDGLLEDDLIQQKLPHSCQLEYVSSCFFNEHSSSTLIASRGAGKSVCAGIVTILMCLFRPKIKVAILGYKQQQASYVKTEIMENLLPFYCNKLGIKLTVLLSAKKEEVDFSNGSKIGFYTGLGRSNIKGFHPSALFIDECDLFDFDDFRGMANSLHSNGNFETQFNLLSTSYAMTNESVVIKMEDQLKEWNLSKPEWIKPAKTFRICLLDVLEKCTDKYQCNNPATGQNCPLWTMCKGRLKDSEGGFYKIDEAIVNISRQSSREWENEMLLQETVADNCYFSTFGSKHIAEIEMKLDPMKEVFSAFDFGGIRCEHGCIIGQRGIDNTFEILEEFTGMGNIEPFLKSVKDAYPNIEQERCFIDKAGRKKDMYMGSKSYFTIMREHGFKCTGLGDPRRKPTFDLILGLMDPADGNIKIKINKKCRKLIKQIRCAIRRPDGNPEDKGHDDLLDCLRYAVFHLKQRRTPRKLANLFKF